LYASFPEDPVVRYQRILKTLNEIGLNEEAEWFAERLRAM